MLTARLDDEEDGICVKIIRIRYDCVQIKNS